MHIICGENIQEAYSELLQKFFRYSSKVNNTFELENCVVEVNNPEIDQISFPNRNLSEKYANAELNWYWSGSNSVEEIGKYAKLWYSISDDGKTNNSAYGYILFKKYGFDQLQQIIEVLKKDPCSRRAVLNISDPAIDRVNTKDMQCTIALQFLIRNKKLHETVYMRSNDVYYGFPYDYIFFVSIGKYIASKFQIPLTKYTHHATSLHMYENDVDKFLKQDCKTFDLDYMKIIEENYEK